MLHVKVSITGQNDVLKALLNFSGGIAKELEGFLKREGAEMEKEIKQSLSVSARGETGPRGGKTWMPSAPGEPPRMRAGNLRAAQGYKVAVNKSTGDFILDVGGVRGGKAEVKYQAGLELGTSTAAPRPHLMPIVQSHLAKWPKGLKTEVVDPAARKGKP